MSDQQVAESHRVRVTFKPTDMKPVEATEMREVVFSVRGALPDEKDIFQRARAEAVDQNVIASPYAVREHWEPYKHEALD